MVWPITLNAWAFKGRRLAEPRLQRHFIRILSAFFEEGVEYLVVGAYAVASHGLPRATGDLDLWVRCEPKFGAPLSESTESELSAPGLVFQIGVQPSRIDMLTSIDGVDFEEAWKHRLETFRDCSSTSSVWRI